MPHSLLAVVTGGLVVMTMPSAPPLQIARAWTGTMTFVGRPLEPFALNGTLAQCGSGFIGLRVVVAQSDVTALFSGTVLDLQQLGAVLMVTFDVHRVWKGDLPKRVVLYRPVPVDSVTGFGQPVWMHFELGQRYVVAAHQMKVAELAQLGVEHRDGPALATDMCGGGSRPFDVADVDGLGPGRAPE